MPLDESTKKLLADSGFSQDNDGQYNYNSDNDTKKTVVASIHHNNSNNSVNNTNQSWQNKLISYTTDKDAGNTELERAKAVYNQKKILGDTAGADAAHTWANQIRDAMGLGGTYDKVTGGALGTGNAKMDAMLRVLEEQKVNTTDELKSQLELTRQQTRADLDKAYATALSESNISKRDAEEVYNDNVASINQQHYIDSELTNVNAQARGIQNSQQMLGLQAGDTARKNSNIRANVTERDQRIADITDRLSALKSQNAIDVANADTAYNTGLTGAIASTNAQYNGALANLYQSDYEADRNQQYTVANMLQTQKDQLELMVKQGQISAEAATIEYQRQVSLTAQQHGYSMQEAAASASRSGASSVDQYLTDQQRQLSLYNITPAELAAGIKKGQTAESMILAAQQTNAIKQDVASIKAKAKAEAQAKAQYDTSSPGFNSAINKYLLLK